SPPARIAGMPTSSTMRRLMLQSLRTAEGSYLAVAGIMAVEQQEVGDLLIGPGPLNAGVVDDWDRPHDQHPRKLGFERPRIGGRAWGRQKSSPGRPRCGL